MTALIRIDQSGLPDGEAGKSRTDGVADGSLVTLTDTSPSGSTDFKMLWTPPGDATAVPSLAATGDPKVWTFSPEALKYGSYLVELVRNAGLLSETRERRVLVVRTPNLGLIIPALNERGYSKASLDDPSGAELGDNNATDFDDPDLNELPYASWWRAMHELITRVDASASAAGGVAVTAYSFDGVTRQTHASLGAALEAVFESPCTAVYDIPPNSHAPATGPYPLGGPANYALRAVAGRGSVVLPELAVDTQLIIEACEVVAPITGGGALTFRRDVTVVAELTCASLDARDSQFVGAAGISADSYATFDRCAFDVSFAAITCTASVDGYVTLTNCAFYNTPSIVFTGGENIGVVRMDARTKFLWDAAGGSVTNGAAIVVEAPP